MIGSLERREAEARYKLAEAKKLEAELQARVILLEQDLVWLRETLEELAHR